MPQSQLSVRSARARALEECAAYQTARSPTAEFYQDLNRRFAIDLEAILQPERRAHDGVDL
jgi:hypothetical protein